MREGLFRKIHEQTPPEKGNLEITLDGEMVPRAESDELSNQEADTTLAQEEMTQEAMDDVIEVLNKELNLVVPRAIEKPDDFKKQFAEDLEHESVDRILDVVDKNIKALSHAYDKLDGVYDEVLNQRLDYKDIADAGVNREMKKRLDDRIHKLQAYKKTTHELIEYLDAKRAESLLRGEKEGFFSGYGEDENTDE